MESVAICLVAVYLGLRGWRSGPRTYAWSAVAALTAGIYLFHFQ